MRFSKIGMNATIAMWAGQGCPGQRNDELDD